jgi:hypothetical protein
LADQSLFSICEEKEEQVVSPSLTSHFGSQGPNWRFTSSSPSMWPFSFTFYLVSKDFHHFSISV